MATAGIRLAKETDAKAIQLIYAPYVRETAISFETEAPSIDELRQRVRDVTASFPWLVCEVDDRLVGYAYASRHRERAAYQWSVDVAVYVEAQAQRRGVGRGLYTSLFELLRLQGFFSAYAGITLPNEASVGLHEALGFAPVGVYEGVGYKLERWHDVGWWWLPLQPPSKEPAAICLPAELAKDAAWLSGVEAGARHPRF